MLGRLKQWRLFGGEDRVFSAVRVIPLAVGLLVALALLPVMLLGYYGARDNTGRLLTINRDVILDGLEQQLRQTLDGTARQMAMIGQLIEQGAVDPADRPAFASFMAGAVQGQTTLVSIGWLEATGPLRRWERGKAEEQTWDREVVRDVGNVWLKAEKEKGPHWNNPVISRVLGEAILPHIQPVMRDGRLLGILITVLTSGSVSPYFDRLEDGITPFVLAGRERVLIHQNIRRERLPEMRLSDDRLPRLDEVYDPILEIIWKDPRETAQNVPGRSLTHWSWVGSGYEAVQYSYRTITGYGTEPWLIGFHRSSLATIRERWVVQGLFWGSLALLIVSVALAYRLGRRMVEPAGEIASAARALERLQFDRVMNPAIEMSRVREVRDTSHALTRAAAVLKRFQTYVPRVLVGQLMAMDEGASSASDREVTVLFMDLANYTSFSDGRSARDVSNYLNRMFAEVGPLIEATGGTIDKYTGDGLMAVWGAPVADPGHVRQAWSASLAIVDRMAPIIEADLRQEPNACRMRLGLHTGRVLAGDLGFEGRIDYTIVGRTVNIAQRCQAALKGAMGDAPVALAVTEAVRRELALPVEGLMQLPSMKGGELAYRVLDLTPAPPAERERLPTTVV